MQEKLYRVTKTLDSGKVEMIAGESQLSALKRDDRFSIGEEVKAEQKKGKKKTDDVFPNPPIEMPEAVK